jgi:AraC-like DNA-binding protein
LDPAFRSDSNTGREQSLSVSTHARHQLGGYREYDPPASLAPFAEALWTHRAPDQLPPGDGAMHRVLPDPALSLAFYCRRQPDGVPTEPKLVVIGPKTRPHIFAFRGGHEIAAVRVKLEWSALILDLVPEDHSDAEHDLAQVLPRLAETLLEPLAKTRNAGEAAGRLAETIVRRASGIPARRPEMAAHALDLVRRTGGRVTVESVAGRMGIPLRTLRRQVRQEAGISLKEYARITRFLHAVTLADRSTSPAWAAIAADTGFCDQSHLVRECRALSGLAPSQVYRERRAQAEKSNPC